MEELRNFEDAVAALEAVPDAADRAVAAAKVLREWPQLHAQVREVRQQAVEQLRAQGLSFAEIGALLGVKRQRAEQIAKGVVRNPPATRKPQPAAANDTADASEE